MTGIGLTAAVGALRSACAALREAAEICEAVLLMPRPPRDTKMLQARLTAQDIEVIEAAKKATGANSLSLVVERALQALIEETEGGRKGLVVMPLDAKMLRRNYYIAPDVLDRLDAIAARFGFNTQQLIRAAIARLKESGHA